QPAPAEQLTLRDPRVLRPLGTEVVARAVRRRGPDQLWQRLGQPPPTPLAVAQRFLGALAVGVVPRQGQREPAATLPERLAPDLHREERPVLAAVAGLERHQPSAVEPALEFL